MWPATQSIYIIDVCLVAALTMATNRQTYYLSFLFSLSLWVFLFLLIMNDLATEHIYM
jgi:hypothetical protein